MNESGSRMIKRTKLNPVAFFVVSNQAAQGQYWNYVEVIRLTEWYARGHAHRVTYTWARAQSDTHVGYKHYKYWACKCQLQRIKQVSCISCACKIYIQYRYHASWFSLVPVRKIIWSGPLGIMIAIKMKRFSLWIFSFILGYILWFYIINPSFNTSRYSI